MNDTAKYNIDVKVETQYLTDQSAPASDRYVFSYTITITNNGTMAAKLLSRHWYITNANGNCQEVTGEGVVGETPHLLPDQSFRYTSGTYMETPLGSMHGTYQMLADDGTEFDALIPAFTLARPGILN